MREWIFFAVLLEVLALHCVGEGGDGVAGFGCRWSAVYGDGVAGDLHLAFGASEEEAFALFSSIDEVDAKAEVEALGIVEEREENVVDVAAVVPIAETSGGHGACGAF